MHVAGTAYIPTEIWHKKTKNKAAIISFTRSILGPFFLLRPTTTRCLYIQQVEPIYCISEATYLMLLLHLNSPSVGQERLFLFLVL